MIQIIKPDLSFKEQLAGEIGKLAGSGIAAGYDKYQQMKNRAAEDKYFKESYGVDLSKLSPEIREFELKKLAQQDLAQEKEAAKYKAKMEFLKNARESAMSQQTGMPKEEGNFSERLQNTPSYQDVEKAALIDSTLSRVMSEERKLQQKEFEANRQFESKQAEKILDPIYTAINDAEEREAAISSAMQAVNSGQITRMGGDFWANVLHLPALKTASGAQLDAAAKAHMLSAIHAIKGPGRNQFLEKKVDEAFAKPGESKEASLSKLTILKNLLDMQKKKAEIASQLEEESLEKYGYVKTKGLRKKIDELFEPEKKKILDKTSLQLSHLIEQDMSKDEFNKSLTKKAIPGAVATPRRMQAILEKVHGDEEKAIRKAKELGYIIPSRELLEELGYEYVE